MITSRTAFKLGDTEIQAVVHQSGDGPTMLNVHDDEDTAVQAGIANIREYGGRVIELAHSGERLITFSLTGRKYAFDPNRIFSDTGIAETLKLQSTWSPEAQTAIRSFASAYLKTFSLDREPVIVALHNTMEGPFSVESFLPDAYLGSNAAAIHVCPGRSKFDFFYVTEPGFFDYLKRLDFNVVLQDNEQVTDDGSLSVYFSQKGIPYINVEAEVRHLSNQIEMLKIARQMLESEALGSNAKLQTPEKPQTSNPKTNESEFDFGFWCLVFGAWCFAVR
jgi:hypothetical protein